MHILPHQEVIPSDALTVSTSHIICCVEISVQWCGYNFN